MIVLAKPSQERLAESFERWCVDADYRVPMVDYLLCGFNPGSFFTSLLANDAMSAITHSHPANTIAALKCLVGWMRDYVPSNAKGSYETVESWCLLPDATRRQALEDKRLIYPEIQETFLVLSQKNG